jgi:hypothetical protein
MKRQFIVTVEMPNGVTVKEMKEYILDAVATWKGQLDPECDLFWLNSDKVRVKITRDLE